MLSERKAAYEQRQQGRQRRENAQYDNQRRHERSDKKREYDEDMSKYMKDYDDTVSMDEIVIIEKKDKKKES